MKSRTGHNKSLRPIIIISGIVGVLILIVAGLLWAGSRNESKSGVTPSPSSNKGNSIIGETSTLTPSPSSSSGIQAKDETGVAPAKPVLQKSSGNAPGSSVPTGAIIEFSCEGTPSLQCDVILTDRTNSAHIINLGKKAISSNGRGAYFALWNWNAVRGSWTVVAKAYSTGGLVTASDAQSLEVK